MSEWIDVLDRLPKDREPVIVFTEYWSAYPFVAHLHRGRWVGERILSEPANVTHWQPLPDPPAPPQRQASRRNEMSEFWQKVLASIIVLGIPAGAIIHTEWKEQKRLRSKRSGEQEDSK